MPAHFRSVSNQQQEPLIMNTSRGNGLAPLLEEGVNQEENRQQIIKEIEECREQLLQLEARLADVMALMREVTQS